jgi:hypothetical protein
VGRDPPRDQLGHGAGKSALVGMLVLWDLSTFENTRINVLAIRATRRQDAARGFAHR